MSIISTQTFLLYNFLEESHLIFQFVIFSCFLYSEESIKEE